MNHLLSHITMEAGIRFGKPCIKGTRITVADILLWLAGGMSFQDILSDYPPLTEEDIRAALLFAAHREKYIKTVTAA